MLPHRRTGAHLSRAQHIYAGCLLALFALVWLAAAWQPWLRGAWLLENIPVLALVAILLLSYRTLPLSRISYTALFIFLCLHEIGAHFTYSRVPYDIWWEDIFGYSLNNQMDWQRNHYDRFVHALYGVLSAYPVREVFLRVADVRGFWGYLLPVLVVMSTSLLFELFEWLVVILFAGDVGMAYLGIQGDIWDSHKDAALASLGAVGTMTLAGVIQSSLDRDFSREWNASVTVKHPQPLGEVAIERLLQDNQSTSADPDRR
ncbi:MAG: DUF2238 domain-containing protein [Pseudomonadota bacterium]